jgi:hypothetical protein
MKETETHLSDKVKINDERQIEKGIRFVGSTKLIPRHRCFEINLTSSEINEAKTEMLAIFGTPNVKRKVIINPNCIYICALNKQNAFKKFKRQYLGL